MKPRRGGGSLSAESSGSAAETEMRTCESALEAGGGRSVSQYCGLRHHVAAARGPPAESWEISPGWRITTAGWACETEQGDSNGRNSHISSERSTRTASSGGGGGGGGSGSSGGSSSSGNRNYNYNGRRACLTENSASDCMRRTNGMCIPCAQHGTMQ